MKNVRAWYAFHTIAETEWNYNCVVIANVGVRFWWPGSFIGGGFMVYLKVVVAMVTELCTHLISAMVWNAYHALVPKSETRGLASWLTLINNKNINIQWKHEYRIRVLHFTRRTNNDSEIFILHTRANFEKSVTNFLKQRLFSNHLILWYRSSLTAKTFHLCTCTLNLHTQKRRNRFFSRIIFLGRRLARNRNNFIQQMYSFR